mmetsp:Transcript_70017/g.121173  ORF Transcript_70017/g.121173 Transcript_70017/m.121173 type:complete len:173 (+) Transcript_70017:78-596(+)
MAPPVTSTRRPLVSSSYKRIPRPRMTVARTDKEGASSGDKKDFVFEVKSKGRANLIADIASPVRRRREIAKPQEPPVRLGAELARNFAPLAIIVSVLAIILAAACVEEEHAWGSMRASLYEAVEEIFSPEMGPWLALLPVVLFFVTGVVCLLYCRAGVKGKGKAGKRGISTV